MLLLLLIGAAKTGVESNKPQSNVVLNFHIVFSIKRGEQKLSFDWLVLFYFDQFNIKNKRAVGWDHARYTLWAVA